MKNDEVQRLRNPKNTKIEMREREREITPKLHQREAEEQREREREECGFFFLEDSGANAKVE